MTSMWSLSFTFLLLSIFSIIQTQWYCVYNVLSNFFLYKLLKNLPTHSHFFLVIKMDRNAQMCVPVCDFWMQSDHQTQQFLYIADLKVKGWQAVDWIQVALDIYHWQQAIPSTVMNFNIPQNVTKWAIISLSRWTLLHAIS